MVGLFALAVGALCLFAFSSTLSHTDSWPAGPLAPSSDRVLVLYAYYENVEYDYKSNFEYFLRVAINERLLERADFVLVLSGKHTVDVAALRARFRSDRVLVVERENKCFDFGSHADGLEAARAWRGLGRYKFFVLVNSSVRGPFMATYASSHMDWTQAFTNKLSASVKLVGTSINCHPAIHVQSMVLATDSVGLDVLVAGGAFHCRTDMDAVIELGEVGATQAVLSAGFSIDCLLFRYSGVDWRDVWLKNGGCNGQKNPLTHGGNDGISVHPLEAIFVKTKRIFPRTPLYRTVLKLSQWATAPNISSYDIHWDFVGHALHAAVKRERLAALSCGLVFDERFYSQRNNVATHEANLEHWIWWGAWHGLVYRWAPSPLLSVANVLSQDECNALLEPHQIAFENELRIVE